MERATVTLETERAKWPNPNVYDDDDDDNDLRVIKNMFLVKILLPLCD
jgi:hypothetical protein